jgi:hypothetical protein
VVIPTFLRRDHPEHLAQRTVLERARVLLDQYMAVQPLIKIAAELDVFASPERWAEVRSRFGLAAGQVNQFIFFAGPASEFRQAVTPKDMASFKESRDPRTEPPEVQAFRGERALTDAITRLIERKKRVVFFTQDKEELSLRPQSTRETAGAEGGSSALNVLAHELDTQGIEARALSLSSSQTIPSDCEVLVIPGPLRDYSSEEISRIEKYLQAGGRLFVALGARRTGLEDLLGKWGIQVLGGEVQGVRVLPGTRIATKWVTARRFNSGHPITRVFKDVPRFEARLFGPRALSAGGSEYLREATPLLETGGGAEGEACYLVEENTSEPPRAGDFAVAMCAEQKPIERPPPGWQKVDARVVVVGARNFLDDDSFQQVSHRDFFMNAMEWLLGREERATVGGQEWVERTLKMDKSIRRFLFWVPLLLLPGAFLASGLFVHFVRRA